MSDRALFVIMTFVLLLTNYSLRLPFIKMNSDLPIINIIVEVLTLVFFSFMCVFYPVLTLIIMLLLMLHNAKSKNNFF